MKDGFIRPGGSFILCENARYPELASLPAPERSQWIRCVNKSAGSVPTEQFITQPFFVFTHLQAVYSSKVAEPFCS